MGRLTVIEGTRLNLGEVTILIGGGNPTEVDVLMQVFSGFGAGKLRRADDANVVKTTLEREQVDLLILDAMLGIEVSVELVRGLRRMGVEARMTPVVMTAANATPSLISQARDGGVNYVVAKPLTPRILFERLVWVVKDGRSFIECDSYLGPCRRVRAMGPPSGMAGRRAGDLPPEVGDASTPNMSQEDIDAMMFPVRKAK